MKIVVLDGYTENPGDLSWSALEQLGELVVYDRTSYEESDLVAERIGDADVAILNKTPISKATMDQCPNLKLIAVLATGYNVVDIAYAKAKGIPVCNVPNYGGYSVSQFAIALMLEACLHIGHHDKTVHDGKWQNGDEWCYWDYPLIELAGKTFGIGGTGAIGLRVAVLARAFGCKVIAYSRTEKQEALELGVRYRSLEEVMAQSDIVSLHVPATAQTKGLISAEMIARMKPGALLINTARGPVVDSAALADALKAGRIAGAGIDVFETEPPIPEDHPLCSAPNTLLTPHVAFATEESMVLRANMVFENVQLYLNGTPRNVMA